MATRTFLNQEELLQAKEMLLPPMTKPTGLVQQDHSLKTALDFSSWLSLTIEKHFRELDSWEAASPIAIGSWGRGELSPGSDLDVIFCGDLKSIENIVTAMSQKGIKLRYRMPEDLNDWSVGVDELEINALFSAKPFTEHGAKQLQIQKDLLLSKKGQFRQKLLRALLKERKLRTKRYDSIANFLEPNLKYGSGGLRDLHQALILHHWFPERFPDHEYMLKVFDYYKCFFLLLRQKLHLEHSHDILSASDQLDLSRWLGFEKIRDFMLQVQKGLSSVNFYSDWVAERCFLPMKRVNETAKMKANQLSDCLTLLKKDSSLQCQALIRQRMYLTDGFKKDKLSLAQKGLWLKKFMDIKQDEDKTLALFRSHLISTLIPHFNLVIGLVQHDQYHRFSVDAHLLQAVREVKKIYDKPTLLGRLSEVAQTFKIEDWNILRWAALYHDLGKGQHGAHEKVGADYVAQDFKRFGFTKEFSEEVMWLVENHLILSVAAFRKNPLSPQTWNELFEKGVRGERLNRLAIFTAIDIRATNPEAWSLWKENLLFDLVKTLRDPSQERHYDFSQAVKRRLIDVSPDFIEQLDRNLIDEIPSKILIQDFVAILSKKELKPLVLKDKNNRVWIRFHKAKDEKGLMLSFTQKLTHLGCNIRQAFIYTHDEMGVYDWFCVKTKKTLPLLRKQLLHNISAFPIVSCSFSQIDLISADPKEWVFSFRAQDKKGLLLTAIQALYQHDLEIRWAKVHTWGRQIDDIFGVLPKNSENPEQILKSLKEKFERPDLQML